VQLAYFEIEITACIGSLLRPIESKVTKRLWAGRIAIGIRTETVA
jgi:hypothetical protein